MRKNKKIKEKDFVGSLAFQNTIKKTKFKQFSLYLFISIISIIIMFVLMSLVSNYVIHSKIEEEKLQRTQQFFDGLIGAGIVDFDVIYSHGFLSTEEQVTYYKKIGNRKIPWEIDTRIYPVFGDVKSINPTRGENFEVSNTERTVRYNHLNNERKVDFYYPHIGYHNLPNELEIAVGLDENKLIEVALSFEKSLSPKELSDILGTKNVDWLWADEPDSSHFNELGESEYDFDHIMFGEKAKGYLVSEEKPYTQMDPTILISGALISGTPSELERFLDLDIIRASVIGVTLDLY